ncbi:MAG: hypothetical protein ACF8SC_09130 [Phycisphaerales bacterium JB037]
MTTRPKDIPNAWSCKFQTPTIDLLLADLPKTDRPAFDLAREALAEIDTARETLEWHGIPWRWALRYTTRGSADPFAYLVPDPAAPLLCLPVPGELLRDTEVAKLARTVREGVASGTRVGELVWCHWQLVAKSLVPDLVGFARACLDARATAV